MKLSESDLRRVEKAALAISQISADTKTQVTDAHLRDFNATIKRMLSRHPNLLIVLIPDTSLKP
jgi:hypothetical protein